MGTLRCLVATFRYLVINCDVLCLPGGGNQLPTNQNSPCRRVLKMAATHHTSSVVYPPLERIKKEARVKSMEQYRDMHKRSVEDPQGFWGEISKDFHWESQPNGKFLDFNFDVREGPIYIKWMEGAKTNLCYNAVDRHVINGLGDKVAFYW